MHPTIFIVDIIAILSKKLCTTPVKSIVGSLDRRVPKAVYLEQLIP
jgi:hypothetical protein